MLGLSVDLFSMGTNKPVVNNIVTHVRDNTTIHCDASSEHSNEDLP